jgi:hypothetical protein
MAKLKLTKSAVDTAQPQAQAVELRDTLVPGFLCKVIPVKVGMALTAHKTVAMFMRYVHTEDDPVRKAAELVANRRKRLSWACEQKATLPAAAEFDQQVNVLFCYSGL